jgi:prolyl-tRNA synthetase
MKFSQSGIRTKRNAPNDAESKNAELLVRGSFIRREMAGVYSYLPLGKRVLRKIEAIVREEMDSIGGNEILMPALTPLENWEKTGRSNVDIAYKPNEKTVLGWSHEEIVTPLVAEYIESWKDLPLSLYQIQTKFRNEQRAKSGILRGREFIMKDMYSFHSSEKDLDEYYEKVKEAYFRVYERCGIKAYAIEAAGGEFTKQLSHEFSVITPAGEDIMIFCSDCSFAQNKEIMEDTVAGEHCPMCKKGVLKEEKCVEVGNIFKLGTKYTEAFGVFYTTAEGERNLPVMGCYGIGVSRLLGTIVEASHDEKGIIWSKSVAPYHVSIIPLGKKDSDEWQTSFIRAEEMEKQLQEAKIEVLLDDRDISAGAKFSDHDLLGIPLRIVISPKTLLENAVEWKERSSEKSKNIPIELLFSEIFRWKNDQN